MKKTTAIFALFLAAFTWGSAFCVLKDTLENVSPIWLLAFRFLLAGIIMTLVCIPRMKKNEHPHVKAWHHHGHCPVF